MPSHERIISSLLSNKLLSAAMFLLALTTVSVPLMAQGQVDQAWKMLKAGASSTSYETRTRAIRALELTGKNAVAEQIALTALKDNKPDVQIVAVITLGSIGSSAAAKRLEKSCLKPGRNWCSRLPTHSIN